MKGIVLTVKAAIMGALGIDNGTMGKVWAGAGVVGGAICTALGGWDAGATALVVTMAIDYVLGFFVACARKSPKTKTGGLSAQVMFVGILKKIAELMIVWLMVVIEPVIGVDFLRDMAVTGYIVTETLSITENMALFGVPGLDAIKKMLDLLRTKKDAGGTGGGDGKEP